jgi:hypothetical protein
MDPNSKIARLREQDEKSLREDILVPLLTRMGYKAVTIYHGQRERGKDIICFKNIWGQTFKIRLVELRNDKDTGHD